MTWFLITQGVCAVIAGAGIVVCKVLETREERKLAKEEAIRKSILKDAPRYRIQCEHCGGEYQTTRGVLTINYKYPNIKADKFFTLVCPICNQVCKWDNCNKRRML